MWSERHLTHVHRRTNVTLASIHNQPNVTPGRPDLTPADANVTLGQSHAQSDVTPDPTNVTLRQIHDHSSVTPDPTNVTLTPGGTASLRCPWQIARRCE